MSCWLDLYNLTNQYSDLLCAFVTSNPLKSPVITSMEDVHKYAVKVTSALVSLDIELKISLHWYNCVAISVLYAYCPLTLITLLCYQISMNAVNTMEDVMSIVSICLVPLLALVIPVLGSFLMEVPVNVNSS